LRAGQDPDSRHDFRVHKFILSCVSCLQRHVRFPPTTQPNPHRTTRHPRHRHLRPPKVLDLVLRFIYPGVEPPKITDLPTLAVLFSVLDKYDVASMRSVLRESLITFLPGDPFAVYIVACRFGFPEEAKAAARASTPQSYKNRDYEEEFRHISCTELFRFVHSREDEGRSSIRNLGLWTPLGCWGDCDCDDHWRGTRELYTRLAGMIEESFTLNPYVQVNDLVALINRIPELPRGCESDAAEYSQEPGAKVFLCPFRRYSLLESTGRIFRHLVVLDRRTLDKFFKKGVDSG